MTYPTSDILETEVDGVDHVMAQHVNELRGAAANMNLRYVKNTSGATVAVGAVGYISTVGEFTTIASAYLAANWAVVVVGGANNAFIVVAVGGSDIKVVCNGNAAVEDFLYTSTTAGQAQPQSYMRPEAFAVVTTANTAGAGGTCRALLYCNDRSIESACAQQIYQGGSLSASDFVATIATLPGGAVLTYNAPSSGDEANLVPTATTQWAKMVLQNSTRSNDALISNCVTGTNTVTLTDDVPGDWQVGDTVTIRSATNTQLLTASYFVDFEFTAGLVASARAMCTHVGLADSGGAAAWTQFHPYAAYSIYKCRPVYTQSTSPTYIVLSNFPILNRRFCIAWGPTGANTLLIAMRLISSEIAAP